MVVYWSSTVIILVMIVVIIVAGRSTMLNSSLISHEMKLIEAVLSRWVLGPVIAQQNQLSAQRTNRSPFDFQLVVRSCAWKRVLHEVVLVQTFNCICLVIAGSVFSPWLFDPQRTDLLYGVGLWMQAHTISK